MRDDGEGLVLWRDHLAGSHGRSRRSRLSCSLSLISGLPGPSPTVRTTPPASFRCQQPVPDQSLEQSKSVPAPLTKTRRCTGMSESTQVSQLIKKAVSDSQLGWARAFWGKIKPMACMQCCCVNRAAGEMCSGQLALPSKRNIGGSFTHSSLGQPYTPNNHLVQLP